MSSTDLERVRRYEFFPLVQRLRRDAPGSASPGGPGPASAENMRFRPNTSMGFPASDVETVERLEGDEERPPHYRVTVNFMGLYGPASPLANHYTEEMIWAGSEQQAGRDFVDIFHHRIISFVYRAWEKYRYGAQFDAARPDDFTRRLQCLIGVGTPGIAEAAGLDLVPLLGTSGLFAARQRSAVGLEGVLRAHFNTESLRIEPCFERRAPIPIAQRLRLGAGRMRLGEDTCLGERILDRSGAFRISIGPLDLAGFRRLLPGGEDLTRLVRLVRLYVSEPLDFHVLLRLKALEVPALRLAPEDNLPLGYLSWLCPRGHEEGRAQVSISSLDPLRVPRVTTPVPPRGTPPAPKSAVTTVKTPPPGSRSAPRVTTIRRA